ncbi:MAG: hypothetical protein IAG10_11015 [Planctomycetaceae bacterium]|nr:hypothetical protein [Planctomycetaceae bacterium]
MYASRVHSGFGFAEVRMAFEMICGQCRGNLLVEHFGVVVACPHCGAHLHVPDPAEPAPPEPSPVSTTTEPVPQPVMVAVEEPVAPAQVSADTEPQPAPPTEEMRAFTGEESKPPPSVEISVVPSIAVSEETEAPTASVTEEAPASAAGDGGFSLSTLLAAAATEEAITEPTPEPATQQPNFSSQAGVTEATAPIEATSPIDAAMPQAAPEPVTASAMVSEPVAAQPNEAVASGLSDIFGSSASAPPPDTAAVVAEQPAAASVVPDAMTESDPPFDGSSEDGSLAVAAQAVAPAAAAVKPANKDQVTVSKAMFVVLISYASAMTLGFGWVLYQMKTGGGGGLEALPDPVPAKKTGFQWYPPRTVMTAGHNLEIGDSQRFGNIKVTVLKVTRGPIKFRHFSNANQSRPPTFPVLKLWLRFENVSDEQEIAPLDDELLFRRSGTNYTEYKSSQFVCRSDEKTKSKPKIVIAYDHVSGSGWDLANLPLDKPLAPHESREYFVPTCEQGLDDLVGNLVWRVHIRKGYSSRGNGVTTLFEVHFDSQDIHDEPA